MIDVRTFGLIVVVMIVVVFVVCAIASWKSKYWHLKFNEDDAAAELRSKRRMHAEDKIHQAHEALGQYTKDNPRADPLTDSKLALLKAELRDACKARDTLYTNESETSELNPTTPAT